MMGKDIKLITLVSFLLFAQNSLCASTRAAHTALEDWMDLPSHNNYGSMNLLDRIRFEGEIAHLGPTHLAFYQELAKDLCGNREFMDSAYLNEPNPPIKKELLFTIADHGMDVAINGLGIYLFSQNSAVAENCGACFGAYSSNNSSSNCFECYGDLVSTASSKTGLVVFGLALTKSSLYLLKDIWELFSTRARTIFEPTKDQKEKEAQKIALYLTLRKRHEISLSSDRTTLKHDYRNWVVGRLQDSYIRGSNLSLMNSIQQHILELG